MLFLLKEEFIIIPISVTYLSTGWGMIFFCHCISLRLIANQTMQSLKFLAPFYGYVRPSKQISGL